MIKKVVKNKYEIFLQSAFENIDENPKKFWGLVGVKSKKAGIPKTVIHDNRLASEASEKAELFNDYFFQQFNKKKIMNDNNYFVNDNLCSISLSYMDVFKVMDGLDITKAQGCDGVPSYITNTVHLF